MITGVCEYCPDGQYSDGSKQCEVCPLHTEARRSLIFNRFDTMPKKMSTSCIKTAGGKYCNNKYRITHNVELSYS